MHNIIFDICNEQKRINAAVKRASLLRYKTIISHLKRIELTCISCQEKNFLSHFGYVQKMSLVQKTIQTQSIEHNELRCPHCGVCMNIFSLPVRQILQYIFTEQDMFPANTDDLFSLTYRFNPEVDDRPQIIPLN